MTVTLTPEGRKRAVIQAKGPASDATVGATSASTITLTYQNNPLSLILEVRSISKVSGLPNGICISTIEPSTTGISMKVFNATSSNVTITANSVTVEVEVEGE